MVEGTSNKPFTKGQKYSKNKERVQVAPTNNRALKIYFFDSASITSTQKVKRKPIIQNKTSIIWQASSLKVQNSAGLMCRLLEVSYSAQQAYRSRAYVKEKKRIPANILRLGSLYSDLNFFTFLKKEKPRRKRPNFVLAFRVSC